MMAVLNHLSLRRYSGVQLDAVKTFIIPAGASLGMGLVVWCVYKICMIAIFSNTVATLLSIVVGMLSYFVLMILMRGISESELRTLPKGVILINIAKKMHLM